MMFMGYYLLQKRKNLSHLLLSFMMGFSSLNSELPRSKLRGIKFSKKLSSPLMGED